MNITNMADEIPVRITGKYHKPSGSFAGLALSPSGEVTPVQGKLPIEAISFSPRQRNGRPKDEARHIAIFAHFDWFRRQTETLYAARLATAELLKIGNAFGSDERERQIRRSVNSAEKACREGGIHFLLSLPGQSPGAEFLWLGLEADAQILQGSDGVIKKIAGWGWRCFHGEMRADYGAVSLG